MKLKPGSIVHRDGLLLSNGVFGASEMNRARVHQNVFGSRHDPDLGRQKPHDNSPTTEKITYTVHDAREKPNDRCAPLFRRVDEEDGG